MPIDTAIGFALRNAPTQTDAVDSIAKKLGIQASALVDLLDQAGVVVVQPKLLGPIESLMNHPNLAAGEDWPEGQDRDTSGADMINSACEMYREASDALKAAGVDVNTFVVRHEGDHGNDGAPFWNVREGWVDSPLEATVFYGYELERVRLPSVNDDTRPELVGFTAAWQEYDVAANGSTARHRS